jgi:hypothetical protein
MKEAVKGSGSKVILAFLIEPDESSVNIPSVFLQGII